MVDMELDRGTSFFDRLVTASQTALEAFLKDHTGSEAAEHVGVSSATINNTKQVFGLTKKKAKGKKKTKKGKK